METWAGKTVLITGASVGIGEAFARRFAREKTNLMLVARREDKLQRLAAELAKQHSITVDVLAKDLSLPEAAGEVFEETERLNLQVDGLINNAGFGIGGRFVETDLKRNLEMLQLNIVTLTELTHRYLPGMLARRRGVVVNVASTAAFQAVPYLGAYAATKAYVLSFSEALHEECRDQGVLVMALCPGATATEFFDTAQVAEGTARDMLRRAQTPEEVVEAAFAGIRRRSSSVVSGLANSLLSQATRFVPRDIAARIAGNIMKAR
ncbi:SDR family oxidoreductase [Chloracidobacterium thermophilum]|uniref:SDR family NAD(P)-dependent oxidoreductase n=1 Tax=Chloracidobacterium thermophilum TaxID=458033 RepID=UPI000738CE3A|nr:SDR family oxidoreductase [Chloracidobacterium thermophilum]